MLKTAATGFNTVCSGSLALLGPLLFALAGPAGALESGGEDAQNIFDGADGPVFELPDLRFPPSQALRPESEPDISLHTPQSGADLFYFTPEEARAGQRRFGLTRLLRADADYSFDRDVPAEIQTQMRGDLAFIEGLRGSGASPLHRDIFGETEGTSYIRFFKTRVSGVGMGRCGGGNAVACVMPFWNPSKMWLTQNYIRFSHPQVSRMMVVFHEARHTESRNGNWPHARCPVPFRDGEGRDMRSIWTGASLAGEPACDRTPLGSYGSSAIMLKNIQKHCANCTDKVRMDAGLYADDQLDRVTDAEARRRIEEDFAR